jgi:hypothetical protein
VTIARFGSNHGGWKSLPSFEARAARDRGVNDIGGITLGGMHSQTLLDTPKYTPIGVSLENMGATESNTCSGELSVELGEIEPRPGLGNRNGKRGSVVYARATN